MLEPNVESDLASQPVVLPSNLQGIPTDCPHREKNGWTGDAHLAAEQGIYNFAPASVYTKWIDDL